MPEPRHNKNKSKQDYQTPRPLLQAVLRILEINQFDIDLAASYGNRVCPRYYSAEPDSHSSGVNALFQSWKVGDGWNWLNPEWGHIDPWAAMAGQEWKRRGARTVLLTPASVGANWFRDHIYRQHFYLFLNARIQFVGAKWIYPKDCMLTFFGLPPGDGIWKWDDPDSCPW